MDHPFEYRAHYNEKGEPCHCPWGKQGKKHEERLGAVHEASKLDWLKERPDLQDDKGQDWIRFLSENSHNFAHGGDKLLPWLTREWQKGRLSPDNIGGQLRYDLPGEDLSRGLMPRDVWDTQDALEEMKKRKQGVDVMQHKVHELMPKVQEFKDWKKSQERKDLGRVLHKFDDGWTMRQLQNGDEHVDEGNLMGHCVGDSSMPYMDQTDNGERIFASLRDHNNLPHATIELTPDHWVRKGGAVDGSDDISETWPGSMAEGWIPQVGPSSESKQFFGKEDSAPLPEYEDRVNQWLSPHGVSAEGGLGEAPELDVYPAEDVDSYNGIHGDNGSFFEYAQEEDNEGRPAGEGTEYNFSEPDYDRIAGDMFQGRRHGWGDNAYWTPHNKDDISEVFDTARQNYHVPALDNALQENYNPLEPNHQAVMDQWEQLKAPWYHPYTGELVQGYGQTPPVDEYQQKMFQGPLQDYVRRPSRVPFDNQGQITPHEPIQGPWQAPYTYTSAASKSLYYRWVFSPTKGVTLGSNGDDHPALVKYHQALGGDVDGQDLKHGYAYRIGNGWRLTDWEHKPVEDPFIYAQVVRALGLKESPEKAAEGSWKEAKEYNWDRLHYALPASELS